MGGDTGQLQDGACESVKAEVIHVQGGWGIWLKGVRQSSVETDKLGEEGVVERI